MNPYLELPGKAFWKTAVSSKSMFDLEEVWNPKFRILPKHKVSTYGSCFAQHIGNALKKRGYGWFVAEEPPESLSESNAKKYNYNVFTSRTGNIYTTSLLKQWCDWSFDRSRIPSEIWEKDGRFYDPFRPGVEPGGFESREILLSSRSASLDAFKKSITDSDFFVFTLGLTESWVHVSGDYEYPICPGTLAGEYRSDEHIFKNQKFNEVLKNLRDSIQVMRQKNDKLKFLITVSPVPLTATQSGNHVLVATMESKSILRAVAGQLSDNSQVVDYFPSYELINSPSFRGVFFEQNLRSVASTGVSFVMDTFFSSLHNKYGLPPALRKHSDNSMSDNDVVCEEEILSSFGRDL